MILQITYSDPFQRYNDLTLRYKVRETNIAAKWAERLQAAQKQYSIDAPDRFYGFGPLPIQTAAAIEQINQVVDELKKNYNIRIKRQLTDINDQDTLNYLHHIFETYHGLLDAKYNEAGLQKKLSDLNILVHKCESIQKGAHPRHVVTYFGLPKTHVLSQEDYQYFDKEVKFGTVYINYVEIGKTLYDFYSDNDHYISPEAFQPFTHYSADFVVKFWNDQQLGIEQLLHQYYKSHSGFFKKLGYSWEFLCQSIGSIPVADLIDTVEINELECRQLVRTVQLS
jgi:hypothetical protein